MPWNYRGYIQFGILISCVPLQLYFSNYPSSSNDSKQEILQIINDLRHLRQILFSLKSWENGWTNVLSWFVINVLRVDEGIYGESPAVEVLEYKKKYELNNPRRIRETRPEELWFRIGQVVELGLGRYRGVIVDWDFNPEESTTPLYSILVDDISPDVSNFAAITEIEQDQLSLLTNTEIQNRFLKDYFSAFDGSQYIPQPWLQKMYPKD